MKKVLRRSRKSLLFQRDFSNNTVLRAEKQKYNSNRKT